MFLNPSFVGKPFLRTYSFAPFVYKYYFRNNIRNNYLIAHMRGLCQHFFPASLLCFISPERFDIRRFSAYDLKEKAQKGE